MSETVNYNELYQTIFLDGWADTTIGETTKYSLQEDSKKAKDEADKNRKKAKEKSKEKEISAYFNEKADSSDLARNQAEQKLMMFDSQIRNAKDNNSFIETGLKSVEDKSGETKKQVYSYVSKIVEILTKGKVKADDAKKYLGAKDKDEEKGVKGVDDDYAKKIMDDIKKYFAEGGDGYKSLASIKDMKEAKNITKESQAIFMNVKNKIFEKFLDSSKVPKEPKNDAEMKMHQELAAMFSGYTQTALGMPPEYVPPQPQKRAY